MEALEFQKHAQRTLNKELAKDVQLQGLALGITDELAELLDELAGGSREKVCEEMGDVHWYIANLCAETNIPYPLPAAPELFDQLYSLDYEPVLVLECFRASGKISGVIKKHSVQTHVLDTETIKGYLGYIIVLLAAIMHRHGLSLREVLDVNVKKLQKRYPNGFEGVRSVKRDEQIPE